jgi:hypothetical protein
MMNNTVKLEMNQNLMQKFLIMNIKTIPTHLNRLNNHKLKNSVQHSWICLMLGSVF